MSRSWDNESGDADKVSTVQFVGITAFHTQIADPLIGGTYMTVSLLYLLALVLGSR